MTETERYDVVVIGGDLPGAMAAALLAARGVRVQLLDTPASNSECDAPLVGLFTAPTAKRLIEALGVGPALRSKVSGPAVGITVALPDRRFVLPPAEPDRRECLGQMFPESPDELRRLLTVIEAHGAALDPVLSGECMLVENTYRNRRAWRRHLDGHVIPPDGIAARVPNTPALRQLVDALLGFVGFAPVTGETLSPAAARALWHVFHGVIPYRDGRAGFRRLFLERIRQGGGTVTVSAPVESLVSKWRRARAVVLADGTRVEGRCFLFDAEPVLQRVGPEQPTGGTDTFQQLRVHGPMEERPDGLRDPCAWLPNAQGPGCRIRVDADGLDLRWRGSAAPPAVDTLSPLGTLRLDTPTSTLGPDCAAMDPYGVYRRPLVGPLKNIGVLGEWIAPGLGLETACLTAWHAAELGARFGRP